MGDNWFLILFAAALPALIAFATLYKFVEVQRVRFWPKARGRVIVSTSEARRVRTQISSDRSDGGHFETRNFAKIVYTFDVAGRTHRGNRVSVMEDMGNDGVAETIAKYPVGRDVTVFYNPRDPGEALLERDAPAGFWRTAFWVVFGISAFIAVMFVGIGQSVEILRSAIPNAQAAPGVVFMIVAGLIAALFAWALNGKPKDAKVWPRAEGRVVSSEVESYEERSGAGKHWRTMFRPRIVFAYDVAGVTYRGDELVLCGRVASNTEGPARRRVAAWPAGAPVAVHYNPDDPAESRIETRFSGMWFLWLVPPVLFAVAYLIAR